METKSKNTFHLSIDSRSRLIRLRNAVVWLLDEDRRFGFDERDISYKLGPCLMNVLSLVWCKPLRTVFRSFRPVDVLDRTPTVFVRLDEFERMKARLIHLDAENMRLRGKLGLKRDDVLSF